MQTRCRLRDAFRKSLLDDVLPFWLRHAPDRECGGYFTGLGRDGSVYDPDKLCLWSQGRIAWSFAYLYHELEARPEWLDLARLGVEFLNRHGFAPGGTATAFWNWSDGIEAKTCRAAAAAGSIRGT